MQLYCYKKQVVNSQWSNICKRTQNFITLDSRLTSQHYICFMPIIQVNIKNISGNDLPAYATDGSSGMDLRTWIDAPVTLKPLERFLFPTGIFIEIPEGLEAQIRPRSGLAIKHGLTCLNTPGTIDSDYRGEIKVILVNLSNEEQVIHTGERIAQIVFQKVEKIEWKIQTQLSESSRGEGGFGHTGKK